MRTAQIEVAGKKLLLVEVPVNAHDDLAIYPVLLHNGKFQICYNPSQPTPILEIDINSEEYKNLNGKWIDILGTITSTEIDFDCSKLMEKDEVNGLYLIHDSANTIDMWVNKEGGLGTITRTEYGLPNEAFYSLLSSQGIHFKNPLGENPDTKQWQNYFDDEETFKDILKQWNEAEKQLWKRAVVIEIKP